MGPEHESISCWELLLGVPYFHHFASHLPLFFPFFFFFCYSNTMFYLCSLLDPQICECPVLISRLEVLNISGNRLTDACGAYLSTILRNCKGKAYFSFSYSRVSFLWMDYWHGWLLLVFDLSSALLSYSCRELISICGNYCIRCSNLFSCSAHAGLYNLNIERCSITSRTIQTVADALDSDSVLSHLSVGKWLGHELTIFT